MPLYNVCYGVLHLWISKYRSAYDYPEIDKNHTDCLYECLETRGHRYM